MIEAQGLTKYFDSFRAIEDISFYIEKGEIVGLIGPNGSGKTTTMRILTCFMPPTKGKAKVAGYDVVNDSLLVRRHIGYFPEGAPLYKAFPVKRYLEFVAKVKGMDHKVMKKRIDEVMDLCKIKSVSNRLIENLSKGYRQRVCLAQSILNDPYVLILDEPTVGLDPKQVVEVRNLIKELSGQRTVLLSSHILSEVGAICNRVIIINKGKIVVQDSIENLYKKTQKENQLILKLKAPEKKIESILKELGANIIEKKVQPYNGGSILQYTIETEKDIRSDLSRKIVNNGWDLIEIGFKSITLEDVYLRLIGEQSG